MSCFEGNFSQHMDNLLIMAKRFFIGLTLLSISGQLMAQNTNIRGFLDLGAKLQDDKVSFEFGEYDLFVTSELNDHISFLGETVFRYDSSQDNEFEVSIERVIVNYNYKGNHSVLLGKQHTQINYWNESYHHGRVFFPTTGRPLLFKYNFIPLHTTGIALQGLNLGKLRFGYTFLVGNGLGSGEITDNDKYKSVTAAAHIKPMDNLQLGVSFYHDIISEGVELHSHNTPGEDYLFSEKTNQQIYSASVAYFGKKFEVLAEGSLMNNHTASTGNNGSFASYLYTGYRFKEKWVPYLRLDYLDFEAVNPYLGNDDTKAILGGIRYEVNYLIVVKLEYQYEDHRTFGNVNNLILQVAIGF